VALAVIDGMGGYRGGDFAARIVADTFAAALTMAPPSGEEACRGRLVSALNGASRAILHAVASGPRHYRGIGAAAVLALVSGDRLHVASAGDSRLYLLRLGRLVQLTRDDTLINEWLFHKGQEPVPSDLPRGVITKALGISETVSVAPSTFALRRGDVILLSTNGLPVGADDASIERVLLDLPDPAEAALALVHLARQSGSHDDVTTVVARVEDDGLLPPGPADALQSRNVP
jgi:protein phosphatase